MQENKYFKDWLFRYQYVYKVRKNEKSKTRFISSLVTDISEIRDDIQVIEYAETEGDRLRNVYIGNVEQADRIICAHYDTPIKTFGSYVFLNKKKAKNKTTGFILFSSILMVLLGLAITLFYRGYSSGQFVLFSFSTLFMALFYGIYFYFLSKIAKGMAERKTLVRNTSSVLALMEMLKEIKDRKTAFAFVDKGSYGNTGVDVLKAANKKNADIYILDSIGSDAPLHLVGNGFTKGQAEKIGIAYELLDHLRYNYIFSSRTEKENNKTKYYLNRSDLKQKELNMENMEKVIAIFQEKIL